jgi:sortase A
VLNPLFADNQDDEKQKPQVDKGYVIRHRHIRTIQPLSGSLSAPTPPMPPAMPGSNSAVELIRRKVEALYAQEPDVRQEITETVQAQPHQSKHQRFMHELSTSGKSLAHIQTEWHDYYVHLPTHEKHEVWQEFYAANARQPSAYTSFAREYVQQHPRPAELPGHSAKQQPRPAAYVSEHPVSLPSTLKSNKRAIAHLKKQVVKRVIANGEIQTKAKQHLHSLAFGLATGFIVLCIFLFGFFNEMFIAPFIQPSRHVSATPIIVNSNSVATSATPEVIIPKINVQIPVVYDEESVNEAAVQRALEKGVIHYSSTVLPGQQGNAAFFGHSSNNIFNKGKYKFAFVLLHELVPGDIFYLTYGTTVYSYRVFDKKIVPPSEISVLNNVPGKTATATLITCDPPGTSNNRLVVWGEQISPDPAGAAAPTAPTADNSTATELPSNGPTMWSRFWSWLF